MSLGVVCRTSGVMVCQRFEGRAKCRCQRLPHSSSSLRRFFRAAAAAAFTQQLVSRDGSVQQDGCWADACCQGLQHTSKASPLLAAHRGPHAFNPGLQRLLLLIPQLASCSTLLRKLQSPSQQLQLGLYTLQGRLQLYRQLDLL